MKKEEKSWKKGLKVGAMAMALLLVLSANMEFAFAWGPFNHKALGQSTTGSYTIGTLPIDSYLEGVVAADIGDFSPLPGKDWTGYSVAWRMHDRDIINGQNWYDSTNYRAFTTNMYKLYATTDQQKAYALGWRGHVRGADPVALRANINDVWTKLMLDHIAYYGKGARIPYLFVYGGMISDGYYRTYGVRLSVSDISAAASDFLSKINIEKATFTYANYLYALALYGSNYNNVWYPNAVADTNTQVRNLRLYGYSILSPNTELLQANPNKPEKRMHEELEKQLGEEMENEIERVSSKLLSEGIIEVPVETNSRTGLTKVGPVIIKDRVKYDAEIKVLQENLERIKEKHPQYKKFKDTGKVD